MCKCEFEKTPAAQCTHSPTCIHYLRHVHKRTVYNNNNINTRSTTGKRHDNMCPSNRMYSELYTRATRCISAVILFIFYLPWPWDAAVCGSPTLRTVFCLLIRRTSSRSNSHTLKGDRGMQNISQIDLYFIPHWHMVVIITKIYISVHFNTVSVFSGKGRTNMCVMSVV